MDMRLEGFPFLKVAVDARIAAFEHVCNKAIRSIHKRTTASSDFFSLMTVSHHGLHYKTFKRHVNRMVQACTSAAANCEATSTVEIKELHRNWGNIYDVS